MSTPTTNHRAIEKLNTFSDKVNVFKPFKSKIISFFNAYLYGIN